MISGLHTQECTHEHTFTCMKRKEGRKGIERKEKQKEKLVTDPEPL